MSKYGICCRMFAICLFVGLFCNSVEATTYFVSTNSAADGPGTTWGNAFHTIQGAVNTTVNGDTVLVTNGVYSPTAEITVNKSIFISSVNGADVTIVDGGGSNSCFQSRLERLHNFRLYHQK